MLEEAEHGHTKEGKSDDSESDKENNELEKFNEMPIEDQFNIFEQDALKEFEQKKEDLEELALKSFVN